MRKLLYIICFSGMILAEESGTFVGFGIGGGFSASNYFKHNDKVVDEINGHGFNAEFIFGYKQFFIQNIGLRYYLNIDYTPGVELKGGKDGQLISAINSSSLNDQLKKELTNSVRSKADLFNAGFNIDLLFNFIVAENLDVGLYGGGQIGFNTISGGLARSIKDMYQNVVNTHSNYDVSSADISFSTSINFGVRVGFFKYNTVELFAKIPMLENELFRYKNTVSSVKDEDSISFKQPYIVGVRYVVSF